MKNKGLIIDFWGIFVEILKLFDWVLFYLIYICYIRVKLVNCIVVYVKW